MVIVNKDIDIKYGHGLGLTKWKGWDLVFLKTN